MLEVSADVKKYQRKLLLIWKTNAVEIKQAK